MKCSLAKTGSIMRPWNEPNQDPFLSELTLIFWIMDHVNSLIPRLSLHANENSVLEATESWAGPGNEDTMSNQLCMYPPVKFSRFCKTSTTLPQIHLGWLMWTLFSILLCAGDCRSLTSRTGSWWPLLARRRRPSRNFRWIQPISVYSRLNWFDATCMTWIRGKQKLAVVGNRTQAWALTSN